jgi:hypothetical protein
MRSRTIRPAPMAALALASAWVLGAATPAAAGTYTISACQADRIGFSSQAFDTYATRGMKWKRACSHVGKGRRGLITSNVLRSGRVERGAQARFVIDAPAGTSFTSLRWSGEAVRRDCRYAMQLYATRPDGTPISIKHFRANRHCPKPGRAQASQQPKPRDYGISGTTRVVQRTVCIGGTRKRFCSARSINMLRSFQIQATVADLSPPSVAIVQDNPFTQGAWTNGDQTVTYTASDNIGIKTARALVAGWPSEAHNRPCDFTRRIPCTNDPGQIQVPTAELAEGSQPLEVQAVDSADNVGISQAVTVRVDRTAPGAVAVGVEGGEGWRPQNSFAAGWQNPVEGDRAPIAAAHWSLCRTDGSGCSTGRQPGAGLARLADLKVPEAGEWALRVWREDAAANQQQANASQPVRLRYDPEPPALAFDALAAADPTKVSVAVSEKVSGIAGGQIELSAEGSNVWEALPTQLEGDRLVTRIDDARLPAGRYLLRSQATDLAGNVGVAAAAQPITLPLRIPSAVTAGAVKTKIVQKKLAPKKEKGRKRGQRRTIRRQVIELRPSARVRFGEHVQIAGQLTNRDGQPLPGQQVQVISAGPNGEQLLATLTTDANGGYAYRAAGSAGSRTIRFVYAGTATVLPAQAQVSLAVPAAGSFHASRAKIVNGGRVVLRGRVASQPLPGTGKLVELQVKQPTGQWTTFRTLRSDPQGRWALRYRFRYVRCHTTYRLRAHIPAEAGYPFAPGSSRTRAVTVRGAQGPCP